MEENNFIISDEDFRNSAVEYRKELLQLSTISLDEALKYMTLRPGIRGVQRTGTVTTAAGFRPYSTSGSKDLALNILWRDLETFQGNVELEFEPNVISSTALGSHLAAGDDLANVPIAKTALALMMTELSESLYDNLWSAIRNASGTTTADLFNGFDSITASDITNEKISVANGNLIQLTEDITEENALDILKAAYQSLDPKLRNKNINIYCSQDIMDMYNNAYLLTHSGINYNNAYEQVYLEGSNKKATFVPLSNKSGSSYIHFAPASNLLVGVDQMSDHETIKIGNYSMWSLTFGAAIYFGVQFNSVDKSLFTVAQLYVEPEVEETVTENNNG